MKNQYQVVLLPTNEATDICTQGTRQTMVGEMPITVHNHIYIVDTYAPITVDDYFINMMNVTTIFQCKDEIHEYNLADTYWNGKADYCKIIATTDITLGLPIISNSFIEAYVKFQDTLIIDNFEIITKFNVANASWSVKSETLVSNKTTQYKITYFNSDNEIKEYLVELDKIEFGYNSYNEDRCIKYIPRKIFCKDIISIENI